MSVHLSFPPEAAFLSFIPVSPSRSLLYRDALSSVLSFLRLPELATAFTVNKEWSAAVQSMRPALFTVAIPLRSLAALLSSRLRRRVGHLVLSNEFRVPLTSNELSKLAHALPQLRSLSTALSVQHGVAPVLLPPQLQRLSVVLAYSPRGAQNELLSAIGQLKQLHTLHLRPGHSAVSLASLQQLPLLRDLELCLAHGSIVEQFAAELRALPCLHRLRTGAPPGLPDNPHVVALFTALLRNTSDENPCTLHWRDFAIEGLQFTNELAPLLLHLPSLESLEADVSRCTRFDFLTAIPRLMHLKLDFLWMIGDAWREMLAVFNSDGLTRLQSLALRGGPCSSDDLVQLLSHTPVLTSLELGELSALSSLSFFPKLPSLSATLTQLTVTCHRLRDLSASHLPSLLGLQQLRVLRLLRWPSEQRTRLTAEDRAPFEQRPCAVLPHLAVFEWTTVKG
jgi:hypothetical protein